jgi:hypothetical protein
MRLSTRGNAVRKIRASPAASGMAGMVKWNEGTSEAANEEVRFERNRQQDDDFCRALRAALYAGKETCRLGVSTDPGTKKPILNYQPPD